MQPATVTRRLVENGSRKWPASPAVTMKPAIIMIHTMVAAAARRFSSTWEASSTRSEVPAAPTPAPISVKDRMAAMAPTHMLCCINCTDSAAPKPPSASVAMPAMIHGVRRPPPSEPWPHDGRSTCSA